MIKKHNNSVQQQQQQQQQQHTHTQTHPYSHTWELESLTVVAQRWTRFRKNIIFSQNQFWLQIWFEFLEELLINN